MIVVILMLLFLAPVLQLALSIMRYRHKIKLPVWATTIIMLVAGMVFSYLAEYLIHPAPRIHPVMPMVLYFGVIITGWGVSIIAIITGTAQFFRWQRKRDRDKAIALANSFTYKF